MIHSLAMAIFYQGIIVTLAGGSRDTAQTELKTIHRISVGENDERYFEEEVRGVGYFKSKV